MVNEGNITSSSSCRFSDFSAKSNATEPLETATAYFVLCISLKRFSNFEIYLLVPEICLPNSAKKRCV